MVSNKNRRDRFNKYYNKFSYNEKSVFQSLTAKIFRDGKNQFEPGTWQINFAGNSLLLPLRKENIWLDWDSAVSIVGHDLSIKKTYEALLKSEHRPKIFFDIGANYGTHSLLFLAQQVKVVSFEPNPTCRAEFESACQLNHFPARAEALALGNHTGTASLYFPDDNTWLGTIVEKEKETLEKSYALNEIPVTITTLDLYTETNHIYPDLIKIDVEGNELSVLQGGVKTIQRSRPVIIFETNANAERIPLAGFFEEAGYSICELPFSPGTAPRTLAVDSFVNSREHNFAAIPNIFLEKWK